MAAREEEGKVEGDIKDRGFEERGDKLISFTHKKCTVTKTYLVSFSEPQIFSCTRSAANHRKISASWGGPRL